MWGDFSKAAMNLLGYAGAEAARFLGLRVHALQGALRRRGGWRICRFVIKFNRHDVHERLLLACRGTFIGPLMISGRSSRVFGEKLMIPQRYIHASSADEDSNIAIHP